MAVYVTQPTDSIDAICWRFYNSTRGLTELVLEANPDLALYPEVLPGGLTIILPEPVPVETLRPVIQLWQ